MYMKYREMVEKKGAKSAPKRIIFYRGMCSGATLSISLILRC
jgi:hypothetical protein